MVPIFNNRQSFSRAVDLFEDDVGGLGPDEWPWRGVVRFEVFSDGFLEFGDAAEDAPPDRVPGDVREEALDEVQPRGTGRREVNGEPAMAGQPSLDLGMLVCAVVVGDQMQRLVFGRLAVDLLQKFQPLGMGVPLLVVGASAGTLLPKAGPWMDTVKRFFGVVLLGVAVGICWREDHPELAARG